MNRSIRLFGLALVTITTVASRSEAQGRRVESPSAAALRDLVVEDSLTPAKAQLRDVVAQLRDTLTTVQALHASIARNMATGVSSVVLSNGRELGKRCRVAAAMAELTTERIAPLKTSAPRGDQALNAYRASLTALTRDLWVCQRDDSVTMAAAHPDQKRIEHVAVAARAAVTRYDVIRDALLKLLDINLPIKGTINPRAN